MLATSKTHGRDARQTGLIVARQDGGPVRLRRNGRQPKAVGLYFSVKSGRHLPYESKLELHDLWRAEVDADVVRSYPQPFTIDLVRGGELTRYTPDRLDVLANGSQRVVEVKDGLTPAETRERFESVAELLAARAVGFALHQRREIEAQPSFSGVEAVQRHRRTQLGAAEAQRLRRLLQESSATVSEVCEHLGGGPAAYAMVCAAAVRRLVRINLDEGLHACARVGLVA